METTNKHLVAVVGAGPAGLFASRELASQGIQVVLFNRDVKPGGLAEYGIYPDKHKMKDGLRNQFRPILELENVTYYGNVMVGEGADFTLDDLRAMGFQAVLVTAGAQGTKWLGLPGENLNGVYHAKDIVYHYNRLPPFSEREFKIGKKVVVIGVGNVMTDIVHWLSTDQRVDEVMAVARRGPAEVKFDKKELEYVACNLDGDALDREIERVTPIMRAIGQDPEPTRLLIHAVIEKSAPSGSPTHFTLHFLASPTRIIGDAHGNVVGLEVEENTLVLDNGEVKARGTGAFRTFDADTVIFAIGDRVDDHLGLPVKGSEYLKNAAPRFPVEGQSYEVGGEDACSHCLFVAGWSRKASTGLVGVARKDGINGARSVIEYLDSLPLLENLPLEAIDRRVHGLGHPVVTNADLTVLQTAEAERARELGTDHFKFASNEEMLQAMGLVEKTRAR